MSSYKSSNALQNSICSFSFTRQEKFNGIYKKSLTQNLYKVPDLKSTRYTSQGLGNRIDMQNAYGKGSPAPDTYKLKSCFDNSLDHKKGAIILEKFTPLATGNMKFPGPGSYTDKQSSKWNKDIQTTLKSRQSIFYDDDVMKAKHCISPQTYLPPTKIQENKRFSNITFGKGIKLNKIQTSKLNLFLIINYLILI